MIERVYTHGPTRRLALWIALIAWADALWLVYR